MGHLKQLSLLLCAIFLVASSVVGQVGHGGGPLPQGGKPPWWRYTVKGEEFSVELPTLPAMATGKVFYARLRKQRLQRQLKTSLDGVVYTIDTFENPKPRQSLEEFIAELNADSALDLTTERNLSVNGFAGKEYSLRNKTHPATVQFFATEKRLYRFAATGSPAQNAGVMKFFSSIVLGKKTEGTKVEDGPGAPLELDGERIYTGREVDTKARLTSKPEPTYTEKARQKQHTGTVILRVVFASNGQIANIRVVQGLRYGLTERAIAAASRITFIPATKDGKPVSMWMQLEYNFYLF